MSETILIKYHEGAFPIECHGAWYDLAVPEDIEMKAGDFKIIPFNISMKMPVGYEGYLAPRSSTFKKWGILQANSIGIIEEEYCGENDIWGMPAYATKDVVIPKGTRIAQIRIQKRQPEIEFIEVEHMEDPSRGGYGSTGEQVNG